MNLTVEESDRLSEQARTVCGDNDLVKFSGPKDEKVEITTLGIAVCLALFLLLEQEEMAFILHSRITFQGEARRHDAKS